MSMTQQYREKLQYIFETTHGCIAICTTADNTLEAVNSSFARMHGYEPDELVGISLDELAASDSIRYLNEGENASSTYLFDTLSFEATHKRKEGSTFPVSINITVIKDENGAIRNRIVTLQDISEDETLQKCNQTYPESKKTTETKVEAENTKTFSDKMFDPQKMSTLLLSNMLKKVDAKERELRTLTDNISDYLVRYDREGRFVYINKSLQSFLGVRFSAIRGKKPTDISELPDSQFFEQTVLRVVETGIQESFIHTFTINGNTFVGLINATPEIDDEGRVQYVQLLTRDITEQKKIEKSLRETNERFAQIYDNSIDVIYLINVTPEGRFIYCDVNAAYETVTGISREAVIGVDVEAIENETFREILLDKFNFCLNKGEKCDYMA